METISVLPVDSPNKKPAMLTFDVFTDVVRNKQFNKQFSGRSYETLWCSYDVTVMVSAIRFSHERTLWWVYIKQHRNCGFYVNANDTAMYLVIVST